MGPLVACGRGGECGCGWRRGSHLIPALPRPGGEGGHAGEVGVRTKGLRTATPSTPQSPAGDSSPYEDQTFRFASFYDVLRTGNTSVYFMLRKHGAGLWACKLAPVYIM